MEGALTFDFNHNFHDPCTGFLNLGVINAKNIIIMACGSPNIVQSKVFETKCDGSILVKKKKERCITNSRNPRIIVLIKTTIKLCVGGMCVKLVIKMTVKSTSDIVCRPKGRGSDLIKKMITASIVPAAKVRPQRSGTSARAKLKAIIPVSSGIA